MIKFLLYVAVAGFFGYMFAYTIGFDTIQSAFAAGIGGKFGCLLLDFILMKLRISIF